MTKYILAGGCDRKHPEYLETLARVITAEKPNPRILSCWFSNEDDHAREKFNDYQNYFRKPFGPAALIVMADKNSFIEQLKDCDVLYLHGGNTDLLISAMAQYEDLASHFEDKVIVGSSAGANYLSTFGYSPSLKKVKPGSGLVGVSCVVHYNSVGFSEMAFTEEYWRDVVSLVKNQASNTPTILLAEGTFAIFDV